MQFTIINSSQDLPKQTHEQDHAIYLCITKSGKTTICKYVGGTRLWENAAVWRDHLGEVVAYAKVEIPDNVLTLCTGKHVDYFDGLKARGVK